MYLIDTDICSAHLRNVGSVYNRFLQHAGRLHISVLTLGELLSWTLRGKSSPKYHQGLLQLFYGMRRMKYVEVPPTARRA